MIRLAELVEETGELVQNLVCWHWLRILLLLRTHRAALRLRHQRDPSEIPGTTHVSMVEPGWAAIRGKMRWRGGAPRPVLFRFAPLLQLRHDYTTAFSECNGAMTCLNTGEAPPKFNTGRIDPVLKLRKKGKFGAFVADSYARASPSRRRFGQEASMRITAISPATYSGIAVVLMMTGSVLAQAGKEASARPGPEATAIAVGEAPPAGAMPPSAAMPADDVAGAQIWATGDYLMGWVRGAHLPPLVTTSPAGTPQASAGVLDLPRRRRGRQSDGGRLHCARLRFRLACRAPTRRRPSAWKSGFFFLQPLSTTMPAQSNGSTILARASSMPSRVIRTPSDCLPGVSAARDARVQASTASTWTSANVSTTRPTPRLAGRPRRLRHLQFSDDLNVTQVINPLGVAFVPGTQIVTADHFGVRNQFNGLELGCAR